MKKRKTYPFPSNREGLWFAVPLEGKGFAVGVIARKKSPLNAGLFGYFFGRVWKEVPCLDDVRALRPEEAILRARLGDLYLAEGRWPRLGIDPEWKREEWPMPLFVTDVTGTDRFRITEYSEEDPNVTVTSEYVDYSPELEGMERDSLYGAGALEYELGARIGAIAAGKKFRSFRRIGESF